jgi:hypothetical protein
MLPFASSAYAEVEAKGLNSRGRVSVKADGLPFGVAAFLLGQLDVYHIARRYEGNENDLIVHPCYGLSFGRHAADLYLFQYG